MRGQDLWGVCRDRVRARHEAGAAAVEFALVLVPFIVLLFGMIQYGLYFYSAQTGSQVANSAARQLSVGNCQTAGTLDTYVKNKLGPATSDTTAVNVSAVFKNADGSTPTSPEPANVDIGGTVTVTLTFPTINMHFPLVPFLSNPSVTRVVQARVEDTTDEGCGS